MRRAGPTTRWRPSWSPPGSSCRRRCWCRCPSRSTRWHDPSRPPRSTEPAGWPRSSSTSSTTSRPPAASAAAARSTPAGSGALRARRGLPCRAPCAAAGRIGTCPPARSVAARSGASPRSRTSSRRPRPFARARAGARSGRSARDARPPSDRASGEPQPRRTTARAGPDALMVRRRANRKAAAGSVPAAASWVGAQRRDASSARPRSYAASRDASSASS